MATILLPQLPSPMCPSSQHGSPPPAPHSLVPSPPGQLLHPAPLAHFPAAAVGQRSLLPPYPSWGAPGWVLELLAAGNPCGVGGKMSTEALCGARQGEQSLPCSCHDDEGSRICEEKEWGGLWPCVYLWRGHVFAWNKSMFCFVVHRMKR